MRDNSAGNAARGQVRAAVERCRIEGDGGADGVGVRVLSGTHVAVADSLVADDGLGVDVRVEAGSPLAALTITRSTVTDNRIGVYADSTGQVHLVDSTVSLDDTGLFTLNAGIVSSAGNNAVLGNFSVTSPRHRLLPVRRQRLTTPGRGARVRP